MQLLWRFVADDLRRYEEYTTVNDVQEVRFCSCSWDKTVRIWDAGVERQVRSRIPPTLKFPDCACRVVVKMCSLPHNCVGIYIQARLTLQGHEGYVVDVACSGNGRKLVTASYDKTARVWDARVRA